jgi:TM2 domain-containing membrane protein YozV
MNCYLHPETVATAFCRSCGRPLCALCQHPADGTIFCADHQPFSTYSPGPEANASSASNPYNQPAASSNAPSQNTSPALAFILGWIPGVGAIYNGQYVKGLVHAVIFGLLVSLISGAEESLSRATTPFLGILLGAFVFYMPFEAYHTAKKRQTGIPVDEWSSLMAPGRSRVGGRTPVGPVVLIGIGVLFLLDTLHIVEFREIGRFWPVALIIAGAFMLYNRLGPHPPYAPPPSNYPPPPANPGTGTNFVETRREQ